MYVDEFVAFFKKVPIFPNQRTHFMQNAIRVKYIDLENIKFCPIIIPLNRSLFIASKLKQTNDPEIL